MDIRLMTLKEAAKTVGINEKTLRAEVKAGKIRFVMVGKRRKFSVSELMNYIERVAEFNWRSSRPPLLLFPSSFPFISVPIRELWAC
jgi:excisionase family DNA binding protein